MTPKQELLDAAVREYRAFHEAVKGLNEEHLTEVWLGSWSIKDIVAHIVGWHRELAPALERMARGERPILEGKHYEDVDPWNARFTATARGTEVADLLLQLDGSHEAFMRAASGVPEERFEAGKTAYRIVDQNTAHHYREHAEQIRAWRARRRV